MLFSTTHFFRGFSSFRIEIHSGAVMQDLGRPCKGLRTGFLVKRISLGRKHVRTRLASEYVPRFGEKNTDWPRASRYYALLVSVDAHPNLPGRKFFSTFLPREGQASSSFHLSIPLEILTDLLRRLNGGVKRRGFFHRTACQQTQKASSLG